MKKTLLGLLLLGSTLFAEVTDMPATEEFVNSNKMKIIDIRTENEWVQMGVIKNAIFMTFFDERGGYDEVAFVELLDKTIEKGEEFALICNTGSRTKLISNYLGNNLDFKVVNLTGGMSKLLQEGFKPEYYNPLADNNSTK